jgi:hypothetical protein
MQYFDNGSLFTVTVTTREIENFRHSWPCSGLRSAPVTFQFAKDNGDLKDSNDAEKHPDADGNALQTIMNLAKAYGLKKLGGGGGKLA